jgi:hypothetical protein
MVASLSDLAAVMIRTLPRRPRRPIRLSIAPGGAKYAKIISSRWPRRMSWPMLRHQLFRMLKGPLNFHCRGPRHSLYSAIWRLR